MPRRCGIGTNGGRGFSICDASGQPVRAQDRMRDVRQGVADRRRADWSGPRFGTHHPLDLYSPGPFDDPQSVYEGRGQNTDAEMAQDSGLPPWTHDDLEGFEP